MWAEMAGGMGGARFWVCISAEHLVMIRRSI